MKWPWVSRARLEEWQEHARVAQEQANEAIETARKFEDLLRKAVADFERQTVSDAARYAELLTKYHQLKLQGFTPEPQASKPEKPSRDPVMEAVSRACAGKGEGVLQSALRQVKIDREAQLSDEEIILRIQRGHRPADEFQ